MSGAVVPGLNLSLPRVLGERLREGARGIAADLASTVETGLRGVVMAVLWLTVPAGWYLADFTGSRAEQDAIVAACERLESDATAGEMVLRQAIEGARGLRDLAQRWLLLPPGAPELRAELEAAMRDVLRQNSLPIAYAMVANATGAAVWDSMEFAPAFDILATERFRQHQAGTPGPLIAMPRRARGDLETVVPISWSLRDRDGRFGGVVQVEFRPADLSRQLAGLNTHGGGFVSLLRTTGELLARSDIAPVLIGQRVIPLDELDRMPTTGGFRYRVPGILDGRDMLVVMRRVGGTNALLGAGIALDSVIRPAREFRAAAEIAASGYSLVMLLCGVIGFGVLRTRRLRREAAALRQGRADIARLHARLPAVLFLRDVAPDGSSRLSYRAGDVRSVTGWENGELDHREDWSDLIADETPAKRETMLGVLRDGSAEVSWQLRQPDGGWRSMVTRMECLTRLPEGGGEVVGYVRDVTAELAAAERVTQIRRELDETLALAPVVVFRAHVQTCDSCAWRKGQGCYREDFFSGSLERVTGWTSESLLAAGGLAAVLDPFGRMLDGIEQMKQSDRWSAEFHLRRPDGSTIAVRVMTSVVARQGRSGMDVVGYLVDITAEREAQVRAISNSRLASLGELAAGMAHELKQPLQAIALATENARSAAVRGDIAGTSQRLTRIADYARHAGATVEHLRRFARGADEGTPLAAVRLDVAVEGALALLGGALRDTAITATIALGPTPPVAMAHLVALEQVMVNLLRNARDALALQQVGRPRRIALTTTADGLGWVEVTVSDNAGGIPPHVMARLFEPFVTTKDVESGTGLGLSICRGMIQQMGGTITATNGPEGAIFRIRLREAPPEAPARIAAVAGAAG